MKTRGAVFEGAGKPLTILDLELPEPGPNDVVVRMTACGVCHTDRHVAGGGFPQPPPIVLGHEGAGIVEAIGANVSSVVPGDIVIPVPSPACGSCWFCLRGEAHNCAEAARLRATSRFVSADGSTIPGFAGLGTFADAVLVDGAGVVRLDTDLPAEQLALIGCGVVTGVGSVLTSPVVPGSSVLVIGCGGVGLSVVQGARLVGAERIIAVDPVASKRSAAKAAGATHVIEAGDGVPDAVRELTGGRGADVAFDAVGSAALVAQAIRATRMGGTTVLIGVPDATEVVDVPAIELLMGRKHVQGSIYGGGDPRRTIPTIVSLVEAGRLDVASMVSARVGLGDIDAAFAAMDRGDVLRSVVVFDR
jgi:S-(hydroxymethyl)glutathione dehydrogenase / alcohol dehydrogenase